MVTPQVADYHHTKILAMARGIGSVSSPLGIQHAQSLPIEVEHDQSNPNLRPTVHKYWAFNKVLWQDRRIIVGNISLFIL